MVRDLIAPEVLYTSTCSVILVGKNWDCPADLSTNHGSGQKSTATPRGRSLQGSNLRHITPHGPYVADSSSYVQEDLIQCMDWNMNTCLSRIPEEELPKLQEKAVALFNLLQQKLPDKTSEKGKWNFEKAHSILHKAWLIILWGNTDNTSCQGPEVCSGISLNVLVYTVINSVCTIIYCHKLSLYLFLTACPYREYQTGGNPEQ
jgi:hypothetical protein